MWLKKLVHIANIGGDVIKMDKYRCCICNKVLYDLGNNAEPIRKGRCCDECNRVYVIPARLKDVEMREVKNGSQQR